MRLHSLSLTNVRLHEQLHLSQLHNASLIVGKNGSGKSTILEAIHLLATGTSDRAERIQELIRFGQEIGRIKAQIENTINGKAEQSTIEALLTVGTVGGRKTQSRLWSINDIRRNHTKVASLIKSVLFRPEDMRLVEGSPGRRRDYLNNPLSQVSADYARTLKTYEQHLVRRNKLLQSIREGEQPRSVLSYWTQGLLTHGMFIQEQRRRYVADINTYDLPMKFTAKYVPSVLSESRLAEYAEKEIIVGHTLIGPHKDELDVDMSAYAPPGETPDFMSVLHFGSRGQQRLAVLWLKMAELAFIEKKVAEPPILLLDDIFSELDLESQQLVLSIIPAQQTFVTTVEEADVGLYAWNVVRL